MKLFELYIIAHDLLKSCTVSSVKLVLAWVTLFSEPIAYLNRSLYCSSLYFIRPFPKPQRKAECLKALKQIAVEPGGKYVRNEL